VTVLDAAFASGSVPAAGAIDLDVYAISAVLYGSPVHPLTFALEREGLRAAFQVLLLAHEWRVWHESTAGQTARWVVPVTEGWLLNEDIVKPRVLAADAETRASLLALLRERWTAAPLGAKASIACVFPEERAWADEVVAAAIDESRAKHVGAYGLIVNLARSLTDVQVVERLVLESETVVDLEEVWKRFGPASLPLIRRIVEAPRQSHELKSVARALLHVGTPEVAQIFADAIQHAPMRKVATAYFHEFPQLAAPLRERASGTTRAAKFAAEIASQLVRTESVVDNVAPMDALPRVLANPPWRQKKRPTRKRLVVPDLALLPRKESFEPTHLTMESLKRFRPASAPELTMEESLAWVQALTPDLPLTQTDQATRKWIALPALLAAWNGRGPGPNVGYDVAWTLLRHFGTSATAGLAAWVDGLAEPGSQRQTWALEPLGTFDAALLAAPMARHLRTSGKSTAWAWLQRHAETALVGLIPAAVGPTSPRRDAAELALRRLGAKGHADRARQIADDYGKDARRSLDEILAWDPLFDCPKVAPKLPPLFRPTAFTRPKLVDGRALPEEALVALGEMLKFSPMDPPYAGLAQVREACEPRSLAELGWDMARAWEIAGAKSSEAWMCSALVHVADDEVVRRTTPAIKNTFILAVLAQIGTDAAIMELATIAARAAAGGRSVYYASVVEGERELLRIAEAKGWSLDELDERVTPTLGMDAEGGLVLDYGPRTFRVGFDECLQPYFLADGQRLRALPARRRTDDTEKVKEAKRIWEELREDVSVIALRRIRAMERGMITGRRWDPPAFRATWLEHPLMIHLARGVVFSAGNDERTWAFRVAEDKSFSDENDATVDIARASWVQIAHPLHLGQAVVQKFTQLLSDYEIIQPFSQLAREAPRLDAAELGAEEITRSRPPTVGQKLSEALLATTRWRQEQSRPTFRVRRIFPDDQTYAEATFDETAASATLSFWRGTARLRPEQVDPVMIAECLRDCKIVPSD
jgi:hypothetical protein